MQREREREKRGTEKKKGYIEEGVSMKVGTAMSRTIQYEVSNVGKNCLGKEGKLN